MKQRQSHVISLKLDKLDKRLFKKEWAVFAKNQFEALMKKNLRIPVSVFHL